MRNCKISFNLNSWIKFIVWNTRKARVSKYTISLRVSIYKKTISNNFYMKVFFFFFCTTFYYPLWYIPSFSLWNVIPRGIWTDKFSDNNMLSSCKNCFCKMEQDSSVSVAVSLPREKTERPYVKFRY